MAGAAKRRSTTPDFVDGLSEQVSQIFESAGEQFTRTHEAIAEQVEERPLASLIIAFGAGLIADRLFCHRRR